MTALLLVLTTILAGTALPDRVPADTVHYRIYRADGTPAAIEDVEMALRDTEVLFIGEEHNDPIVHFLQLEFLQRAFRLNDEQPGSVALSMEMFARDVQYMVDEYLQGIITEDQFLKSSVPWDNYESDYRPLVEFAKNHKLDVIAANAPRRYANRVTRMGRESLADLSDRARSYLAPLPYAEASEKYAEQFAQAMVDAMEEMAEMAKKEKEKAPESEMANGMCKCGMMEGMQHGEMEGMQHGEMEGMQHGMMEGMQHGEMEGMQHGEMEGMQHGKMEGMQHGEMEGMQHGKKEGAMKEGAKMEGMQHGKEKAEAQTKEMIHVMPADTTQAEPPAHAAPMAIPGAMPGTGNILDAQSLWDATMAYAIAEYHKENPDTKVVHVVGGFHVQTGTGIPEHLDGYVPGTKTLVISVQSVSDITVFNSEDHENLGDFVILSDESLPRTFETGLR